MTQARITKAQMSESERQKALDFLRGHIQAGDSLTMTEETRGGYHYVRVFAALTDESGRPYVADISATVHDALGRAIYGFNNDGKRPYGIKIQTGSAGGRHTVTRGLSVALFGEKPNKPSGAQDLYIAWRDVLDYPGARHTA